MANVTLQRAVVADAPEIVRVIRAAKFAAMPWLPDLHSAEGDARFFAGRVIPVETVELALLDGAVVGVVAHHETWVNQLYIDPPFWRLGIGEMLLGAAKAAHPHLQLWAFQGNHGARAFYKAAGFVEVEFTDGQNCEEKIPDVRLEWRREGA